MNQDREYSYEDMIQLYQEHKITLVQFIEALPEYHPEWEEWLSDYHREKDDQAANDFLTWREEVFYRDE